MCVRAAVMCDLEMQLVSEGVPSAAAALAPPTNALRNMALNLSATEVCCLLGFLSRQS
jgi:hypothetical protein